jgi:hypothetical protein
MELHLYTVQEIKLHCLIELLSTWDLPGSNSFEAAVTLLRSLITSRILLIIARIFFVFIIFFSYVFIRPVLCNPNIYNHKYISCILLHRNVYLREVVMEHTWQSKFMCMDIIFKKQHMYRIILHVHLVISMQLLK